MGREHKTRDRWIKCISTQGNIRGVAIQGTELAQYLAEIHKLKGMAAQGMGEAAMGALLLASNSKPGERLNLNIQGSGRFQQALVDAYPNASVRGYVIPRDLKKAELKAFEDRGTGPWGDGLLSVLRTKEELGSQPYIGTVPLLTGYLAKDLTFYWAQSEQIPSAMGLVVNVEKDKVTAAGGFLIQALPGASSEELRAIEHHINDLESMAAAMAEDTDPVHLLSRIFQSTAFMIVEERNLRFSCNCSLERVERALTLVGATELRSMQEDEGKAVVHCDFCESEYKVAGDDLQRLITNAGG